jgi:hypothetical protein
MDARHPPLNAHTLAAVERAKRAGFTHFDDAHVTSGPQDAYGTCYAITHDLVAGTWHVVRVERVGGQTVTCNPDAGYAKRAQADAYARALAAGNLTEYPPKRVTR